MFIERENKNNGYFQWTGILTQSAIFWATGFITIMRRSACRWGGLGKVTINQNSHGETEKTLPMAEEYLKAMAAKAMAFFYSRGKL